VTPFRKASIVEVPPAVNDERLGSSTGLQETSKKRASTSRLSAATPSAANNGNREFRQLLKGLADMNTLIRIAVLAAAPIVIAGCGSGTANTSNASGPQGTPAAANPSSASYKQGLKAGTTGFAEVEAFKGTDFNRACQLSFNIDFAANKQDYMAGCLYGLNHQSADWTQRRK
jgi:hypothetical protein